MAIRRILLLGDPLLRAKSLAVASAHSAATVLEDLRDTLHEFQRTHGFGRGISAVQIGSAVRVIYMEFQGAAYSIVNPELEFQSHERFTLWDDCFSFPDLLVRLERAESVRLRYIDQNGDPQILQATGALSELIQHEMDHLDGILAIDRALDANSLCVRDEWQRRYLDGSSADANEPGDTSFASNSV